MLRFLKLTLLAAMLFGLLWPANRAAAQFRELARRLPADANVLVALNVEKILDSTYGRMKGWRQNNRKMFDEGLSIVPPNSQRFLMAAELDLEYLQPMWEVAMVDLVFTPNLEELAKKRGGIPDSIGDLEALALPKDAYVVNFGGRTVGAIAPANRQATARWLRSIKGRRTDNLSPYLREALGYAENVGTEIIIAMDLQDMIPASVIRQKLGESKTLKDRRLDFAKLADLLAGIRGVTLGITLGKQPFGKIKVDFSADASMMKGFAKPLLLEVLAKNGAHIEEFEQWTPAVNGKQITLEGTLTSSGMRRIFSVVDTPVHSLGDDQKKPAGGQPQNNQNSAAQASLQYFQSVEKLIKDLRKDKYNAQNIGAVGKWFDKYARKVDNLPTLNVDEELIQFGSYVSTQLRNATGYIKGNLVTAGAQKSSIYPTYSGAYGWRAGYGAYGGYAGGWGVWNNRNVGAERRAISAQTSAKGYKSANNLMLQLDEDTAKVRRDMTQKYQIQF